LAKSGESSEGPDGGKDLKPILPEATGAKTLVRLGKKSEERCSDPLQEEGWKEALGMDPQP